MSIVQLGSKKRDVVSGPVFLSEGFRPFFLGGLLFAILSITFWILIYSFNLPFGVRGMSTFQWHAHEMIYGYSMAIIVGFLLTAISNWVNIKTLHGYKLGALFLLWLFARFFFAFGEIRFAFIFDILFLGMALVSVLVPIIKTKSYKQLGIASKMLLFLAGNISFYLGFYQYLPNGMYYGVYAGLYLVVSLILTIGGRVMPGFISNGIGSTSVVRVPKILGVSSLFLFLLFFINELFLNIKLLSAILASALFLVNSIRLYYWHDFSLWKKPLLWGLFLSFVFITFGFLLFSLHEYFGISKYLAIHAFTYGGIGFATLSMISRVSLGHTGRSVHNPPRAIQFALYCLVFGFIFRVIIPLFVESGYFYWIFFSQVMWIFAFLIILFTFGKIYFESEL